MTRVLLLIAFLVLVYSVLKTVFRAAVRGYHEEDSRRTRLMGEDMVLDPECRTYVLKERAITRRIDGKLRSFCSESCAKRYEERKPA